MSENKNNGSSYMPVGTTLQSGKYRIESHLASGGFGNTYKAKNLYFDEIVAIKEFYMKGITHRDAETQDVSVSNADNEPMFIEQKQKFLKEAKRIYKLSKLGSGNIVDVRDFFEENGTAYYVMGYIDGKSLSQKVKEAEPHFRLPQREVYGYVVQILDALEVVHEKNLFHLDLKPGNVMVDKDGKAMLIDFGASKQTHPDGSEATRTALPYTPGYAPLEQMEQDLDNIGAWTDLYSLGATTYFLLTGTKPPRPLNLIQEGENAFHFPDDITPGMRQLVARLMKPSRNDRFQTVEEVKAWMDKNIRKPEKLPERIADSSVGEDTIFIQPSSSEPRAQQKPEPKPQPKPEPKPKPKPEPKPESKPEPKPKAQPASQPAPEPTPRPQLLDQDDVAAKPVQKSLPVKYIIAGIAVVAVLLGVWGVSKCGSSQPAPEADSTPVTEVQTTTNQPMQVSKMKFSNALGEYLYTGPVDADNLPHGIGEAVFTNSTTAKTYKGGFVHGVMDGPDAEYDFVNGDRFIGSFKDGHFDEGTLTIAETGETYKGKFDEKGVPPADENGNPTAGTWYDKNGNKL